MRLHLAFALIAAAAAAAASLAACAVNTDPSVQDDTESSEEALASHSAELVGAYTLASGLGDFSHLVLKQDGSFFTETEIVCITTPCINPRTQGTWSSTRATPSRGMTLSLRSPGAARRRYFVSLAGDGSSMKLAHTETESAALYDRVGTYCGAPTDCAGQPASPLRMMCIKGATAHTVCEANTCQTRCTTPTPTAQCTTNADCRLFDDYCTGCDCRALSTSAPSPTCSGPGVRCFRQPCQGRVAACVAGTCAVQ